MGWGIRLKRCSGIPPGHSITARGSTRSTEVNELTKQIIAESVAEEYAANGINNNINSLYSKKSANNSDLDFLGHQKKPMPTIKS